MYAQGCTDKLQKRINIRQGVPATDMPGVVSRVFGTQHALHKGTLQHMTLQAVVERVEQAARSVLPAYKWLAAD